MSKALETGKDRRYNRYARRTLGVSLLGLIVIVVLSPAMPPEFLPPAWGAYREMVLAALVLLIVVDALRAVRETQGLGPPVPPPAPEKPVKSPIPEGADYGEVLAFLAMLQDKGRFLDFVMEDITPYDDAQVAGASRVVHQGCSGVIREYLALGPVFAGQEGEGTVVDKTTDPHRYRLLGKVGGTPPYKGVVIHRGWKTTKLALPRYSKPVDRSAENVITPMEIEVR
ncbi:MAG: DUF2760 domain-containing protein [Beggiatoa sp.]|nr:DUF2760 domain-containing protein [Beggiatoa sp.]